MINEYEAVCGIRIGRRNRRTRRNFIILALVHQKSHVTWLVIESRPPSSEFGN
jgi:hypothetical protein